MPGENRHPLIPPREVDPRRELPELELEVLARWRERDVFAESLRMRAGAPRWSFYEGPPTANGPPGSHHVLSRVFKDIYPRFQTMRGHLVERKGGWDCHGLPVEIAVEQELGIKSKAEVEQYGIGAFNARCRESVFTYLEEWNRLTERIGFWLDLDDAYRTLDESYIESVWWALSQIDRRGLLYEGHKVSPYCPRCETTLSSHEVAQGYRDVVDPSVYLQLPVTADRGAPSDDRLLAWTTTPWTLPGNVAVAVSPNATYAKVRLDDEHFVLIVDRVGAVLGERAEIIERFDGAELVERYGGYEGPIFAASDREPGPLPILVDEFVTTEDGTGIVHLAPAFGEDDYRVAAAAGIFRGDEPRTLYNPVKPDGTYDERPRSRAGAPYSGRFVKDPELTRELIEDLDARDLLLRVEQYEHSYPHCWRCGTPLLYYAKPSWYIATTKLRRELLDANETVDWHPPHVKHGRFGDWLANNVDWALSRDRYWGTPIPVWRCGDCGHDTCVGSVAELSDLSDRDLSGMDLHRPYVDDVTIRCPACTKGTASRIAPVLDAWFDSGSMPTAQLHYPFENAEAFDTRFPADFICEAIDQTRGWFYSLLAVNTLVFDRTPYRNVVCLSHIVDQDGAKMSKSRGNVIDPWSVLRTRGAEALRWYMFSTGSPWTSKRVYEDGIDEATRQFLLTLWNVYSFFVTYASLDGWVPGVAKPSEHVLDRWIRSRLHRTVALVTDALESYQSYTGAQVIAELVDDLSNWYVRRSRPRFWKS
ncbi:MAG TPA: isoleucine--tRNA ligase, partial [Solirubrobacteraceae bacterium]|nr:isoleucine--tRNA ligase [Solirubrobacteraceae bacterium]